MAELATICGSTHLQQGKNNKNGTWSRRGYVGRPWKYIGKRVFSLAPRAYDNGLLQGHRADQKGRSKMLGLYHNEGTGLFRKS